MKKTMMIACGLFLATVTVNAQDSKMWLGGTAGYSSSSSDNVDTKISGGSFGPTFGYMINENLAVGLGLSYSGTKTTDGIEELGADFDGDGFDDFLLYDSKSVSGLVIAPFVRYYKGLGDNLKLYGQLSIGIGSGTTSWDGVTDGINELDVDDVKYSTLGLNVAPGIQYSLGDKWSINTSIGLLGYNSRTDKDAGVNDDGEVVDVKSSSIDFGLNLNDIKIGVQYHF